MAVERFLSKTRKQLADHLGGEVVAVARLGGRLGGGLDLQGTGALLRQLRVGDEALLLHVAKDEVAPLAGLLRIAERVVAVRRADQAGERGAVGDRQLVEPLAEVEARARLDPGHADRPLLAQVEIVEVQGQDAVLAEAQLQIKGQPGLGQLALQRAARREEEVLGELLRDRAAALHGAAPGEVVPERARDAARVDAPMVVEPPVLGGDHGLLQRGRDLLGGGGLAAHLLGARQLGCHKRLQDDRGRRRDQAPTLARPQKIAPAGVHGAHRRMEAPQPDRQLPGGLPLVLAGPRRLAGHAPVVQQLQARQQALRRRRGAVVERVRRGIQARREALAEAAQHEARELALGEESQEPQRDQGRADRHAERRRPRRRSGTPGHQSRTPKEMWCSTPRARLTPKA